MQFFFGNIRKINLCVCKARRVQNKQRQDSQEVTDFIQEIIAFNVLLVTNLKINYISQKLGHTKSFSLASFISWEKKKNPTLLKILLRNNTNKGKIDFSPFPSHRALYCTFHINMLFTWKANINTPVQPNILHAIFEEKKKNVCNF